MEENKMEIFHELIKREPNILSLPIEQLAPISYVGHEAVKYAIGINKKLDKLPLTLQQKARWLADAQDMGDIVIDIEAHIGELLPSVDEMHKIQGEAQKNIRIPERKAVLPNGINSEKAYIARQIKDNPDIVEEVKKEAREIEDIPTKTAVLNKIRAIKAEKIAAQLRDEKIKQPKSTLQEHLDKCINMQSEINVILASIVQNKDQVKEQSMYELARLIRRAAELLKNYTKQEKQKWQKLLED